MLSSAWFTLMFSAWSFLSQLAQTDIGSQVGTGLVSGGVVGTIAILATRGYMASQEARIADLKAELIIAHESHSKHLDKEDQLVTAMNTLTTTTAGLKNAVEDMSKLIRK